MTLGVLNNKDEEILRKDFTVENEPQYVNLENNVYSVTLDSFDKPTKIVMYLFDEEKQWSGRYEKTL
jgi:hypothetical protein